MNSVKRENVIGVTTDYFVNAPRWMQITLLIDCKTFSCVRRVIAFKQLFGQWKGNWTLLFRVYDEVAVILKAHYRLFNVM